MPYINAKISTKLTDEKKKELKAALGKAITAIPGKTETYLMVCIEDSCDLWLGGDNSKPHAFFDVRILGSASADSFSSMTGEICRLCGELLGIASENVYAAYSEYEHWGWNGRNF